jgi:hypothetical protein
MLTGAESPSRSGSRVAWLRASLVEANKARAPVIYDVPSIISAAEQSFLFRLAKYYFRGEGVIVDAGVFMGASTKAFVAGLRQRADAHCLRSRRAKPIQSYDLGVCNEDMANRINQRYGSHLKSGDCFLPYLQKNVRGSADLAILNQGDICQYTLSEPCEILFLDVCKTREINWHTVKTFYTRLIPGKSLLIHQDFIHPWLPWIHVTMGWLADYFEFIGTSLFGSAVWLNSRQIVDPGEDPFLAGDSAALERLFNRATSVIKDSAQRGFLDLAHVQLLFLTGRKDEARTTFNTFVRERDWLCSQSWLWADLVKMRLQLEHLQRRTPLTSHPPS